MSDAYDRGLQQLAHDIAAELDYSSFMQEGVYSALGGPSFETIAECKMLRSLGADAVGELSGKIKKGKIECFAAHCVVRTTFDLKHTL